MSREIIEAIRAITGVQFYAEVYMFDAEVTTVDEGARTCDVKTIGGDTPLEIPDVRLMAEVEDGTLILPAVGSIVIVTYNKNLKPFISQFSEVKKIVWTVGKSSLDVTDDKKFVFNDGENFGLVKVKELTQKLNDIENLLNAFIGVYNGHSHPSNGAPTGAQQTDVATPTQQSDIENTDIKH